MGTIRQRIVSTFRIGMKWASSAHIIVLTLIFQILTSTFETFISLDQSSTEHCCLNLLPGGKMSKFEDSDVKYT